MTWTRGLHTIIFVKKLLIALLILALLPLRLPAFGEEAGSALTAIVAEGPLHLRTRADRNASSLGRYKTGAELVLLADSGDFLKVRTPDGKEGYMMKRYLDIRGELPPREEDIRPEPALDQALLQEKAREQALARGIDPGKPMIALTFDDGPQPGTTEVLAVLKQYGALATFFILGKNIEGNEEILRERAQAGHELGVHSWYHSDFTKISQSAVGSQVKRTMDTVLELTGREISLVRPPFGALNRLARRPLTGMGLPVILWNVDSLDWKTRSAKSTAKNLLQKAAPGAIVLMHDVWLSTAEALKTALPELLSRGYQLVTVSEMMSFRKEPLTAGNEYSHLAPEMLAVSPPGLEASDSN